MNQNFFSVKINEKFHLYLSVFLKILIFYQSNVKIERNLQIQSAVLSNFRDIQAFEPPGLFCFRNGIFIECPLFLKSPKLSGFQLKVTWSCEMKSRKFREISEFFFKHRDVSKTVLEIFFTFFSRKYFLRMQIWINL